MKGKHLIQFETYQNKWKYQHSHFNVYFQSRFDCFPSKTYHFQSSMCILCFNLISTRLCRLPSHIVHGTKLLISKTKQTNSFCGQFRQFKMVYAINWLYFWQAYPSIFTCHEHGIFNLIARMPFSLFTETYIYAIENEFYNTQMNNSAWLRP